MTCLFWASTRRRPTGRMRQHHRSSVVELLDLNPALVAVIEPSLNDHSNLFEVDVPSTRNRCSLQDGCGNMAAARAFAKFVQHTADQILCQTPIRSIYDDLAESSAGEFSQTLRLRRWIREVLYDLGQGGSLGIPIGCSGSVYHCGWPTFAGC